MTVEEGRSRRTTPLHRAAGAAGERHERSPRIGKPTPVDEVMELDDTYSFFIHCYHLKDWLANDDTFGRSRREIEKFVAGTPALALCGDVANSIKHLKLDTRCGRRARDAGGRGGDG